MDLADLFGQVVVTQADIALWLDIVARLAPDSPRRAAYCRMWNVPDKIRHAKESGQWPPERF